MANPDEQGVSARTPRGQPASGQVSSTEPALAADDFSMPFEPGQVVANKYQILELLGVGGIGFVVAALHIELGEKVALKFLRPEALANAEAVGRFAREARATAQVKSEHVARVFDVGHLPGGVPFIVMEHLEGKDLGVLVQQQGALPIPLAVEYVLQACEALAAAHVNGIVHRDIKPENLFLARQAEGMEILKVVDFGISKVALTGSAFESRHPLVQTTMAMGSPTYMSPEQIRASKDIDARTDLWSLGCVLYELCTGQPAFDAPSLTQVTAVILEREPQPLRSLCPAAAAGLEAIVKLCLAKDPAARFQNVGELALALYPYGPPRGRTSVERCCSLLRGAGLQLPSFENASLLPPSVSLVPYGPSGATSLPSVESPVLEDEVPPFAHRRSRALAALALGLLVLGVVAVQGRARAPLEATPLEPAPAAAPPPAPLPSAALRSRVDRPLPPPAAPAPSLVPLGAPGAASSPRASGDAPLSAHGTASSRSSTPTRPPPSAAPAAHLAKPAAPAAKASSAAPAVKAFSAASAVKPSGTPKPRTAAPAPKPKTLPSPRPAPTVAGELDIGF